MRKSHRDRKALGKQRLAQDAKTAGKAGALAAGIAINPIATAVGYMGATAAKQLKKSSDNPSPTTKVLYPAPSGRGTVHGESVPNPKWKPKPSDFEI
jgi:hypothetical protein